MYIYFLFQIVRTISTYKFLYVYLQNGCFLLHACPREVLGMFEFVPLELRGTPSSFLVSVGSLHLFCAVQ